jgi:hypothetical protein
MVHFCEVCGEEIAECEGYSSAKDMDTSKMVLTSVSGYWDAYNYRKELCRKPECILASINERLEEMGMDFQFSIAKKKPMVRFGNKENK